MRRQISARLLCTLVAAAAIALAVGVGPALAGGVPSQPLTSVSDVAKGTNGSDGAAVGLGGATANANGGDVSSHDGDSTAVNSADNDQSNQISGRDSANDSSTGGGGSNASAVCNGGDNENGSATCNQQNSSTTTQNATANGGNGGYADGMGGAAVAAGRGADADASGGDVSANGGDAKAANYADTDQSNQVSGRDSANDSRTGAGGDNWSAVCNGGRNSGESATCNQQNTSDVRQNADANGGDGGTADGQGGVAIAAGDGSYAGAQGHDVSANGGDAKAVNYADVDQTNQISGRDSANDSSTGGGSSDPFVCNGGHNSGQSTTCNQQNSSTIEQNANADGEDGGDLQGFGGAAVAAGPQARSQSNGGTSIAAGPGASAEGGPGQVGVGTVGISKRFDTPFSKEYGNADGRDAEAVNKANVDQTNQASGRDSANESSTGGGSGSNWSAVCNGGGNSGQSATCNQQNSSTIHQNANAGGPSEEPCVDSLICTTSVDGSGGGGRGGDNTAVNAAKSEQTNQASGRDSANDSWVGGGNGSNWSKVCNGGGNSGQSTTCNQQNSSTIDQNASAGSAPHEEYPGMATFSGGGDWQGDRGGDNTAVNAAKSEQTNQASGRDSANDSWIGGSSGSDPFVCNGGHNSGQSATCNQQNSSTIEQNANAGSAPQEESSGIGALSSGGGWKGGHGGDNTAVNAASSDQTNQASGRDSANDSWVGGGNGSNWSAVCNGGGNSGQSTTCNQQNSSTIHQDANAGSAPHEEYPGMATFSGGGDWQGDRGGDNTAVNAAKSEQTNQASGRDSANDSWIGGSGGSDPFVCNGGHNSGQSATCNQQNSSTIDQDANAGAVEQKCLACYSGAWNGHDDNTAVNVARSDQTNQASGRDSANESWVGGGNGSNWSAVCNGGGNSGQSTTCNQQNSSTIDQDANAGKSKQLCLACASGPWYEGGGRSGDNTAVNAARSDQTNQASGRDSANDSSTGGGSSDPFVCNGGHNSGQSATCNQQNSSTIHQNANAGGVKQVCGLCYAGGGSGGDNTAVNAASSDQTNQASGRDSANDSSTGGGSGSNWSAVCNGGGNSGQSTTCNQQNSSTIDQDANAGKSKQLCLACASGPWYEGGGRSGDNTAVNAAKSEQTNQASGRDSANDSWVGGGSGSNWSAVCNGGHNSGQSSTCNQQNSSTIDQKANAGTTKQFCGICYAGGGSGGDNTAVNAAKSEQTNQVSGRDSANDSWIGGSSGSDPFVCNGGHNSGQSTTCNQQNSSTIHQDANAGTVEQKCLACYSGAWNGHDDNTAVNVARSEQTNQASGRDSANDSWVGGGNGSNWSAVCNGGGNSGQSTTCNQQNSSTIGQDANAGSTPEETYELGRLE